MGFSEVQVVWLSPTDIEKLAERRDVVRWLVGWREKTQMQQDARSHLPASFQRSSSEGSFQSSSLEGPFKRSSLEGSFKRSSS